MNEPMGRRDLATMSLRHLLPRDLLSLVLSYLAPDPKLYIFGGANRKDRAMVGRETEGRNWRFSALTPLPQGGRYCHCAVALDGCVYIAGGYFDGKSLESVLKFDPFSLGGEWSTMPPMRRTCDEGAAAAFGGLLFIAGGRGAADRDVDCFDPYARTWTQVAPMLTGRDSFTLTRVGNFLYAVGGYGVVAGESMERYDPVTDSWILWPLPWRRAHHAAVEFQGRLCVIGGWTGHERVASVQVWDPVTELWSSMPPLNQARTNHTAVSIDDRIYVLGGRAGENSTLKSIEMFSTETMKWQELEKRLPSCDFCQTAVLL